MSKGTSTETLLGQYVDLMNAEGRDSKAAKKFRKKHSGNKPLTEAIARTHSTQDALKAGTIK